MSANGILPGGCHPGDSPGPRFPRPVDVEVDRGVWDLRADPERLDRAAKSWRAHGDQTSAAAEDIHRACRELLDTGRLEGATAQRFDGYESELIAKLDQYEGVAERVAEQLAEAAASLRGHQRTLDGMRSAILAKVPGRETRLGDEVPPPTHIVFSAASFDDLRAIEDAKAAAEEVRAEVDRKNAEVHDKLDEIARDLGMLGREPLPRHSRAAPKVDDRFPPAFPNRT